MDMETEISQKAEEFVIKGRWAKGSAAFSVGKKCYIEGAKLYLDELKLLRYLEQALLAKNHEAVAKALGKLKELRKEGSQHGTANRDPA